jgi:hypothetical protein
MAQAMVTAGAINAAAGYQPTRARQQRSVRLPSDGGCLVFRFAGVFAGRFRAAEGARAVLHLRYEVRRF